MNRRCSKSDLHIKIIVNNVGVVFRITQNIIQYDWHKIADTFIAFIAAETNISVIPNFPIQQKLYEYLQCWGNGYSIR